MTYSSLYCCHCRVGSIIVTMSYIFSTQGLVDLVASHHNLTDDEGAKFNFLEVGCGSGAICLSILSEYPQVN